MNRFAEFWWWRVRRYYTRAFRIFGPRFASARGSQPKFKILVSSDIEQYRADTFLTKEPDTLNWIKKELKPNDIFFDVGANIGLYSLYAASLEPNARVYAFEPEAQNFSHLCLNIYKNKFDSILPVNLALADKECFTSFHLSTMEPGSSMHSVHAPTEYRHGGAHSEFKQGLFTISIDCLLKKHQIPAPDLLKIDVDGIELDILQGCRETFRAGKPRSLLIEVVGDFSDPNSEASRIRDLLEETGLKLSEEGPVAIAGNGQPVRNAIFRRFTN